MFCLHVCQCTTCILGALGGQKKASGPPGLELQMIVSSHVGSRNAAQSSGRTASGLNHGTIPPYPYPQHILHKTPVLKNLQNK